MRIPVHLLTAATGLTVIAAVAVVPGTLQARPIPPGGPNPGKECLNPSMTYSQKQEVPSKIAPGKALRFNLVVTVNNECGEYLRYLQYRVTLDGTCGSNILDIRESRAVVGKAPGVFDGKPTTVVNRPFEAQCVEVNNGRPVKASLPLDLTAYAIIGSTLKDGTPVQDERGISI